MNRLNPTRRQFVTSSAAALAGATAIPYFYTADAARADKPKSKNDRLAIGVIGLRSRGTFVAERALPYGDVVAICDVDREVAEKAKEDFGGKADLYEDYRQLLDRQDVDMVIIATPDHWHTAQLIAACRAGKDVFCEKPLTLTVDEGKLICQVVKQTDRVVQVGNWRRSDPYFRLACEMVRAGRIGKLQTITVTMAKNATGGPFQDQPPPAHLNWDMWLGQTPLVPYCPERCHFTFRWWYDYSGGMMTDWGAHFLDVPQWALGMDTSGPLEIDGQATFPTVANGYDVATRYGARLVYPGGVEVLVDDSQTRYGILFEGEGGRIFVNDGGVYGKPAEQLKDDPLPREEYTMYAHDNLARDPGTGGGNRASLPNHMANFIDCIKSRHDPISEVVGQHRTATVCHLATISMRLGRKLTWDPDRERFVGDDEANRWLSRPQRKPYQIEV
jgi:predicted dehydrogenase